MKKIRNAYKISVKRKDHLGDTADVRIILQWIPGIQSVRV
jgi:hypothetical protein